MLAYFDYIERRMLELDEEAKQYLRDRGTSDKDTNELKHDTIDNGSPPTTRRRIDLSCIQQRRSGRVRHLFVSIYSAEITRTVPAKQLLRESP
ncbi:hypothetical protein KIN20_019030 [Parelaphostrongylus tenuis]|uniref:Uncharacterized protein n=1 Tax=Parelaphostrongylus tenuis TaxID=148309 RepID=A0AAD5N2N6_PARTN|nr:hypothetical protein KIN20_019030 [Parelaphostrongylus tenuis]